MGLKADEINKIVEVRIRKDIKREVGAEVKAFEEEMDKQNKENYDHYINAIHKMRDCDDVDTRIKENCIFLTEQLLMSKEYPTVDEAVTLLQKLKDKTDNTIDKMCEILLSEKEKDIYDENEIER
jgi:ClpP class serine protease